MNRVGINLLWLVPGVVGGSETYTVRLLSGLAERYSDIEYTLFALPELAKASVHEVHRVAGPDR